ncbi:MAG: beta-ketoacyl synthase chain length factor [Parafilimonas sp.]|nr:beta-ketoacyl synthase chain length factor [Parafilimonas sp.]
MKIFIRSASCISPQPTFDHQLFNGDAVTWNSNYLKVIEPDYKTILDVKLMRRMSRIVRIGLAAALRCLKEAELKNIDAITMGTAYGCMEDSEKFLKTIIEQDEQMLSPTSFIQSTHNTVAAQIALALKCNNYNNTFVHRGFSFEHALIDAMLLLQENKPQNVLCGSEDEMTDFTFNVLKRFGLYKYSPVPNNELYDSNTKGSIAGEGAAFFILSNDDCESNYAQLEGVETFYKPGSFSSIEEKIREFLAAKELFIADIDLVITGKNGDVKNDRLFNELENEIFKNNMVINYKHLCGEYPTASSFAMWLAANIIKMQRLPKCFADKRITNFKNILICNSYQNKYHSLILLTACDQKKSLN